MSNIQYLNRVEIAGVVGDIRITEVSGLKMARIAVCTQQAFRNSEGAVYLNTDWHNVVAFNGEDVANIETIKRRDAIKVEGRLRTGVFSPADGDEVRVTEILAHKLEIVGGSEDGE